MRKPRLWSHNVAQAGFELCDPPVSASQAAGIMGMHHHAWLMFVFFYGLYFLFHWSMCLFLCQYYTSTTKLYP
uniref:Uncharacterized protein n=1 Tax=Spermophilus dauricus TaxID=99837 RepID=A0A8C9PJ14_SPEDA